MGAVDPTQTGAANSLNTLMRSLGTSFAGALAGVILAQTTTDFGGYALPSENGFLRSAGLRRLWGPLATGSREVRCRRVRRCPRRGVPRSR